MTSDELAKRYRFACPDPACPIGIEAMLEIGGGGDVADILGRFSVEHIGNDPALHQLWFGDTIVQDYTGWTVPVLDPETETYNCFGNVDGQTYRL